MQIQFNRNDIIGAGAFGSVFQGQFDGRQVAVKRVDVTRVNDNEELVLKQLDHPNIIKLFHSEKDIDFKYFAFELCHASLDQLFMKSDHQRKYKGPKLPHHFTVFLQLALGLEYIHSKRIIHRDIKPENVLISGEAAGAGLVTIKWADFGLSRSVNERGTCTLSGLKGTEKWFAPEMLKNDEEIPGRGTVKSDVFALALVYGYLLLDGQHLYGTTTQILNNIRKDAPVNMERIKRKHYARDLLFKMLTDKPEKRISSSQVVIELKSIQTKILKKERELRHICQRTSLHMKEIKLLIQIGIDVNGKDNAGCNALHLLCGNNSTENLIDAIQLLIQQHGIDVNGKDNFGSTALHFLCAFNSSEKLIDAIQLLIQLGIDKNEKNNVGNNALHLLCRFNSSEKLIDAIQLLIQLGIDKNGKDNDGSNALHILCQFNSTEKLIDAIQLLIQLGIDKNGKDNDGSNALHYLCGNNSSAKLIDAIQLLIQHGIDVNGKDNDGRNALHFLCANNSSEKLIDAIQLLIQLGIDKNEKNNVGSNALHILCAFNSSEKLIDAIQLLIQLGIDVNGKDNVGSNALHILCRFNSSEKLIDVIQFLIQHGIEVNSNEIDARSMIHRNNERIENIEEIIQLLGRASINLKKKKRKGKKETRKN